MSILEKCFIVPIINHYLQNKITDKEDIEIIVRNNLTECDYDVIIPDKSCGCTMNCDCFYEQECVFENYDRCVRNRHYPCRFMQRNKKFPFYLCSDCWENREDVKYIVREVNLKLGHQRHLEQIQSNSESDVILMIGFVIMIISFFIVYLVLNMS